MFINKNRILIALLWMCFSKLAFAEPDDLGIILSAKEEIKPMRSLAISLNPLANQTAYDINCLVSAANPQGADILLGVETKNSVRYTSFSLNNDWIMNNKATLKNSENTINIKVASNGKDNFLTVKNLNDNASVELSRCFAKPIQAISAKETLMANSIISQSFFVFNDTKKTVTIGVGNLFPEYFKYTIAPGNSTWVHVSSDNQNIHIYETQ